MYIWGLSRSRSGKDHSPKSYYTMQSYRSTTQKLFLVGFLMLFAMGASAQHRRAMTLDDIMEFHHIDAQTVNYNGNWVAYSASPDRGDGYGILISADGQTQHRIERGERPQFSTGGDWVVFTQRPPLAQTEGVRAADRPNNAAVLLSVRNGSETRFENVRQARFSQTRDFLFVHHVVVEDEGLSKEANDALRKAGGSLRIRNLSNGQERMLPFVESWTVDSLSSALVYIVNDTLKSNNGLYHLSLENLQSDPGTIELGEKIKFDRFTWHDGSSRLAYMRAYELEKDTIETAALYTWAPGDDQPEMLIAQREAPDGYFLPYDNRLVWTHDGARLFFGLRPHEFAARAEEVPVYESVLDSIRATAGIDIWHVDDPMIKTQEKASWNQVRRQNLMSVFHMADRKMIQLSDDYLTGIQPTSGTDVVVGTTSVPYAKRTTWEGRFNDVYLVNVYTGERNLILEESQAFTSLSPDGRYFLYFDDAHWHVLHVNTGRTMNLTENLEVPFYSETHDTPSTLPGYRIAGWMEDMQSVLIYDRYDIWMANLETGSMRSVTGGQGRDMKVSLRLRNMDGTNLFGRRDQVWLEGFGDDTKIRAVYMARLDREGVTMVYDVGQNIRLRELSGDGTTFLFTHESHDVFPDLWVSDLRFRNPNRISDLQQQLSEFNWGKAELVSYRSADGVPLQAVMIKPGDYDPSKKYPVFVYYYEKSSQRLHEFNQTVINHRPSFGYYASNGYVVYLPDIHFIDGRPGMSAVKSLVPAMQTIIDMGVADPAAIGLHGHSWSGYQTAYVVTQTDIFTAAIAGAPVSNMTSAYGGIRWGSGVARQFQYETGQSRIGYNIFDRRYLYIENSPLFYAHEINTPMLLMHGDVDEAVPWEQSIEMYLAMRRAGKDVIFLQYRDEPHHPQKYSNKIDYTIRMKEYFDHYLKGVEAPEWIRTGIPYRGN